MKPAIVGTYQAPGSGSKSAVETSCCTRTKVTISVADSDIPASVAVILRGTSDAASVYSPTTPMR